ncbi:Exopolyphosphatase [Thecaphora frezii]
MVLPDPIYTYASTSRRLPFPFPFPSRRPTLILVLFLASFALLFFLSTTQTFRVPHIWSPTSSPDTPHLDILLPPSSRPPTQQEQAITHSDMPKTQISTASLDAFVADTKAFAMQRLDKPSSSNQAHITIVMGNEAGDLDSAASAISLSYLLTRFGPPTGTDLPASIYVPLIQSNHGDAVLRPENTAAFLAARIRPDQLLCLDDLRDTLGLSLDSAAFAPTANVSIGLVDHPSLTGLWGGPRSTERRIDIVVDHHEDAGDHRDASLRLVRSPSQQPVGSAASLVAGLYADRLAAPSGDVPSELADLLLSAIAIDTDNIRPAPRGKATQADFDAVKLLVPLSSFASAEQASQIQAMALANSPLNQTADVEQAPLPPPTPPKEDVDPAIAEAKRKMRGYYEVLAKSKQMVSHLSGRDLLRRDYKEVGFVEPETAAAESDKAKVSLRLGFASVPLSVAEWLHKDRPQPSLMLVNNPKEEVKEAWNEWWKTLDGFMEERKLDLAVMTGSFREHEGGKSPGKHRRELVLAFAPRNLNQQDAATIWTLLRDGLESDSHVDPDQVDRRLMLQQPWKGQRLPDSAGGKRERVAGIDNEGRRTGLNPKSGNGSVGMRYAKVYKQANDHANRKVVLPAVVAVLRGAVKKM